MDHQAIAVAGYLCLDLFPDLASTGGFAFASGKLQEIGDCRAYAGGVVGNTGLALHCLGQKVRLAGKIGDDLFGRAVLDYLDREAPVVPKQIILDPQAHTGYCLVLSPPNQDRMFLAHRGVNDFLGAADLAGDFLDDVGLFHFGYPPLCQRLAAHGGRELRVLFEQVIAAGAITSMDLSLPSPGTFSATLDWPAFLANMLPVTQLFLPSRDELAFMLRPAADLSRPQQLRLMSDRLLAMGAAVIVIKLGCDGLYLRTTERLERLQFLARVGQEPAAWVGQEFIASAYSAKVVGTTGAGDAAIAGFLTGVMNGNPPATCAKLANATAACNVSAQDAISGLKPLAEVREMLGWRSLNILSFEPEELHVLA